MSHRLRLITEKWKIKKLERSIGNHPAYGGKVLELWQCDRCRSYWEYDTEYVTPGGLVERERWHMESLAGR